ncbi:phosphodiester glycosidase family protein [Paenibacillus sp. N1-5-1-14]|uniref:stalk domain-containing protein n=1 Tax=Paenibacillus radicibacter TaxID=2972488 RepID=UPI002159A399|nr:phosphodiester glycosidase family protein [Paenibacillus radicibacter]MCR8645052.1 phosphodiester glycosidase family protein [Paenibacillus radicibacter]
MKIRKSVLSGALAVAMICQTWTFVPLAKADSVDLVYSQMITAGAVMRDYNWTSVRNKKTVTTRANVIEVDLTNPYVSLDTITGKGGNFTKKQSILGMTKESGAVAGINGDFFNTQAEGVPIGPQINGGQIIASTPDNMTGLYAFAIDKNNEPMVDKFAFKGSVTAKDGSTYKLDGVNKTYYWYDDGTHSHIDGMFLYTSAWAQEDRSNDGKSVPTEILVRNGIIEDMAIDTVLKIVAPKDGYIIRAGGKAGEYAKAHFKIGDPLQVDYQLTSSDGSKVYDKDYFKTMIGGHSILLDNGKATDFSRDVSGLNGYRARTAVGYSKDKKTAYLITVDKAAGSDGMSFSELQSFMAKIGVWKAVNLDGGGSTQMVSRELGDKEPTLKNSPEGGGYQRPVVNGFGVFSNAPKGTLAALFLKGPSEVFLGERVQFTLEGYDQYYNPLTVDETMQKKWSVAGGMGTFDGDTFIPGKVGKATITAEVGNGVQSKEIRVMGKGDIASLGMTASNQVLKANETYKFTVTATDKKGRKKTLDSSALKWEVKGTKAEIKDGQMKLDSIDGVKAIQVIGTYDGMSAMFTLSSGYEKMWYDMDNTAVQTNGSTYPAEIEGSVTTHKEENGNKSLEINYDFTNGTGNKAVYADFNNKNGAPIEGSPQAMKIKVFGDNSRNWVRAEVVDADGDLNRIDISKNVDWTGWKELEVNLAEYHLTYPFTIKNVYVATPAESPDERELKGQMLIDDIAFMYKGGVSTPPKKKVKLTMDQKTVYLDGKAFTLDQAPVEVGYRAMVPIRFVMEAFGGEVLWDPNDWRASILYGDKLVQMWNNNPDIAFTGKKVTNDVAPQIINGLMMVPLRAVSEYLNWKVGWDAETRTITLE